MFGNILNYIAEYNYFNNIYIYIYIYIYMNIIFSKNNLDMILLIIVNILSLLS